MYTDPVHLGPRIRTGLTEVPERRLYHGPLKRVRTITGRYGPKCDSRV